MNDLKSRSAGLGRILRAVRYSVQGLRAAWQHEAAFRQEICVLALLAPATIALRLPTTDTVVLLILMAAVLAAELVNSAIEAIVDKTTPEVHPLAGRAKDCGSAAVLVAALTLAAAWLSLAGPAVWRLF